MAQKFKLLITQSPMRGLEGSFAMSIDGSQLAVINVLTLKDPQPYNAIDLHLIAEEDSDLSKFVAIEGRMQRTVYTSLNRLIEMGIDPFPEELRNDIIKMFNKGLAFKDMPFFFWIEENKIIVNQDDTCSSFCKEKKITEGELIGCYYEFNWDTKEEVDYTGVNDNTSVE